MSELAQATDEGESFRLTLKGLLVGMLIGEAGMDLETAEAAAERAWSKMTGGTALRFISDLMEHLPHGEIPTPGLDLGTSTEAYELIKSLPECVQRMAEIGDDPAYAWARIGCVVVGATRPKEVG